MDNATPLLTVRELRVHYPVRASVLSGQKGVVKAVDGVSFDIEAGETLGLVGESGCGKTTLGRTIVHLINPTSGSVSLAGEELGGAKLRAQRRQVQMIFQDPYNSLDPRMTVSEIIGEALDIHGLARKRDERRQRIESLLADVGLNPTHAQRYPHEFSGGQRQRIGIARALAVEPQLIICDEPVSALDVSVQAQIINLLQDLQKERGVAYLFVAHDVAVVEHISRRIMVMYLGKVVELGAASAVVKSPQHPYTQALISAVPQIEDGAEGNGARIAPPIVLSGEIPSPLNPPAGCPFHPRCPRAESRCATDVPAWREVKPGRWASCHFAPFD